MQRHIYCNNCFAFRTENLSFHVTNCGHVYCAECKDDCTRGGDCKICGNACASIQLTKEAVPLEVREYFGDPCDVIDKGKMITDFQLSQLMRLSDYLMKEHKSLKDKHHKTLELLRATSHENSELRKQLSSVQSSIDALQQREGATPIHEAFSIRPVAAAPSLSRADHSPDLSDPCSTPASRTATILASMGLSQAQWKHEYMHNNHELQRTASVGIQETDVPHKREYPRVSARQKSANLLGTNSQLQELLEVMENYSSIQRESESRGKTTSSPLSSAGSSTLLSPPMMGLNESQWREKYTEDSQLSEQTTPLGLEETDGESNGESPNIPALETPERPEESSDHLGTGDGLQKLLSTMRKCSSMPQDSNSPNSTSFASSFKTPETDYVPRSRGRATSSPFTAGSSTSMSSSVRFLHTPYRYNQRHYQALVHPFSPE